MHTHECVYFNICLYIYIYIILDSVDAETKVLEDCQFLSYAIIFYYIYCALFYHQYCRVYHWYNGQNVSQSSWREGFNLRSSHIKESKFVNDAPFLALNIIRHGLRVKWSNQGNGVRPPMQFSVVTIEKRVLYIYTHAHTHTHIYIYIYIYMYIYIYIYCHPQTDCFVLSELFRGRPTIPSPECSTPMGSVYIVIHRQTVSFYQCG